MAQTVMAPDETEAGRKRHPGRTVLILLFVLLILLVVADRAGAVLAQRELAAQAQKQLTAQGVTTSGQPSVHIHGFPFLTQVAAGHYDRIDIQVKDPAGQGVRLDTLDIVATDVDAPTAAVLSGHGQVYAGRIAGTATISWTAFRQLVDVSGVQKYGVDPEQLTITGGDDGKIAVSAPVSFMGVVYQAKADGTLSVAKNVLHVALGEISVTGGAMSAQLGEQLNALRDQLTFDTRVPTLPYHLSIDGVHASEQGIQLDASATGVVLGG
jgi:hypothetical protein